MSRYYVYLATNPGNTVLYTGVTRDLRRRIYLQRRDATDRYRVAKLLYVEVFRDPGNATRREQQLRSDPRQKKLELIARENPKWRDLWGDILS